MFKRSQVLAVSLGSAIHLTFWAYHIGTSGRADWLCGEMGCWALVIADQPISRLYAVSNQSVTWGSLLLGSLWWSILAAGIANVAWLLALWFQPLVAQVWGVSSPPPGSVLRSI